MCLMPLSYTRWRQRSCPARPVPRPRASRLPVRRAGGQRGTRASMSRLARAARQTGIMYAAALVCVTWALTAPAAAGASQLPGAHQTPRVTGIEDALFADSCTSATACAAVGYQFDSGGTVVALAETWDGKIWRVRAVPSPAGATGSRLFGISCTSASTCTAVGTYVSGFLGPGLPLAERWNGINWRVQAAAIPAGAKSARLLAVSCSSATACTAVGGYSD